jgi:hypothetical protein
MLKTESGRHTILRVIRFMSVGGVMLGLQYQNDTDLCGSDGGENRGRYAVAFPKD